MEVQPQSVQINFNNKIITLHNVTIVKNPKIITIDAKHYTNLLKRSPKLDAASNHNATSIKLQMPSLMPTKSFSPGSHQSIAIKLHHQSPVIKEVPKVLPTKVISVTQHEVKSTTLVTSTTQTRPIQLKAFPHKPQSVIISPPKANTASNPNLNSLNPIKVHLRPNFLISHAIKSSTSAPTKVIISPSLKNKISPCIATPPIAKKICQKLDFRCIFSGCNKNFDASDVLVDHMKQDHADSIRIPIHIDEAQVESTTQISNSASEPTKEVEIKAEIPHGIKEEPLTDQEDENEVKDLIMDFEDPTSEDTAEPESPEFEKHVAQSPTFETHIGVLKIKEEPDDSLEFEKEYNFENYEYFSSIMEPICELSCEDDFNDDENEAMRLYREAMEVNYQQNGIKKRGRRRQIIAKPLVENTASINGILASLLENASIRVPPGRGRGRRKEMNEEELEIERTNGVCLFSCNKCDLTFKFAGDLAKHVRSHTISSPYQVKYR